MSSSLLLKGRVMRLPPLPPPPPPPALLVCFFVPAALRDEPLVTPLEDVVPFGMILLQEKISHVESPQ